MDWAHFRAMQGERRLGESSLVSSRELGVVSLNIAKAAVDRAGGILKQLWALTNTHSNCVVCLQETKRWAKHLLGKTFNQHYLFGSKHSDCCILLPVTLLHTVKFLLWGTLLCHALCSFRFMQCSFDVATRRAR